MGICSYCEQDRKLTKEHIFPSFLCEYNNSISRGGQPIGWREKPQKMVEGDAVVKDVCADCNNVVLSKYDGHAKNVLDNAGIFRRNYLDDTLTLEYDYKLFSRWLLKLAFNSSRASGIQEKEFGDLKKHIIEETSEASHIFILVGLFSPVKLTEEERNKYGLALDEADGNFINPFQLRFSWPVNIQKHVSIKQIVIGAMLFRVFVFDKNITRQNRKDLLNKYLETMKGMSLLRKNKSKLQVKQIKESFLDSMVPHMLRPEVSAHLEKLTIR